MRLKIVSLLLFVTIFVTACTPALPEDTNSDPFSTENGSGQTGTPTAEPLTEEERQQAEERNQERDNEAQQIAEAVNEFTSKGGQLQEAELIPSCDDGVTGIGTIKGLISLDNLIPQYLSEIPTDPRTGSANDSGYALCRSGDDIVVTAPNAELDREIRK
ncbi:MAG: hypothetical protein TR69_WS6001001375 [candidate division WS6 bacterium OLB20]|uniref:Uncharacterized protein n=1 Tax=candidate division WS6 bacterium OLB20 TaxID=1617426 RepID=A0A136LWQ0_9BACT|nr:MAG: hypothetical protein TR69_WS6001001375 [candidate division WS6 bacterium OLB20]